MAELNRRRLLTGGAAALAAGAALTQSGSAQSAMLLSDFGGEVEPFHGTHQSGITTAPQAHALFVALDLKPGAGRQQLAAVLRLWSADAARLTQGTPALADTEPELALRPARLTVTVGLGPTVFARAGLGHRLPSTVYEMPAFGSDRLESHWCGGDLLLQLCADDPMALAHAARVLLKNVRSLVVPRWRQSGFRHAAGADRSGATMRNLMGQVDGTVNLRTAAEFDRHVWDHGAGQAWFAGGTVLVLRRIRAEMDTWDKLDRESKEFAVGRRLANGAPLTGHSESDEPDLSAQVGGIPVIPPNAHIALARHRNPDELMLRRPYNYDDPPPAGVTTDSGLLFAAYQRDPGASFVPVQRRLAAADALNTWVTTIGSATFAILPGAAAGEYLGQSLLD
ncbi:Dyp-type peroxidase [Mycolicibacterium sp. J2]|uniref:Dyp-type peroxidase n=1 Tax=Mycolicibacterium sp. J2 TaxID=2993511 RepID=UPI00224A5CF6|nr:Dyp-type peroxidase [Mycolicibacterium sp. J2]MCX2714376.1 Dyp-type peroxidase [Mycolicibacterium sp. J2]